MKNTVALLGAVVFAVPSAAAPEKFAPLLQQACLACHDRETAKGDLDLSALRFEPGVAENRSHWIRLYDRVAKGEMPPDAADLAAPQRARLLQALAPPLEAADRAEVAQHGRGPLRRLNRDEYEQNLRDVLQLPTLDIRDMLPEDREGFRFNKTTATLDISRVQLTAYLDAADAALRQAMASGIAPPPVTKYRAVGTLLFPERDTFGNREAMFFAKDNKAVDPQKLPAPHSDATLEMALFRSAHWPYYGYPKGFVAQRTGDYRVRFSARAVLQTKGYELVPATAPLPMTFRARKPSGPDVSGDVRATGGLLDIAPTPGIYETTIRLRERETFEYSLLGLPVPLARNVNNGPPTYRYPPFPPEGQPGVAFQWLEVEGPLSPSAWPPPAHRVLFDDLPLIASPDAASNAALPVEVLSQQPAADAKRLLRRFVKQAARESVPEESLQKFERLILARLEQKSGFAAAMLAGYKAFLCSGHFLYLHEPRGEDEHHAIAARLSHFLSNTRPDAHLMALAADKKLRSRAVLRAETQRLIGEAGFERFVKNFTDYWLSLRHVRRDESDIRLYPEYRFDDYLVESAEMESRAFFSALVRDNLPARAIVDSDFVYANDRLARHYQLPPQSGSALRRVALPAGSPYGGVLTQAAVLKVTSNGTSTSPVLRGAWIMERILGEAPPPPPANVPAVEPDIRGAKSIRELLALHTQSKSCASCHAKFDPVGLALENFDVLGGYRTRYRGVETGERIASERIASERIAGIDRAGHDYAYSLALPVDASGKLSDGRSFQDIRALKAIFAANPRALARNLLHQFTVYATGTPVRFSDRAAIEAMLDSCAAGDYRVRDLLMVFVQSQIFLGQAGSR